jgi:hypothetical protein
VETKAASGMAVGTDADGMAVDTAAGAEGEVAGGVAALPPKTKTGGDAGA